MKIRVINAILMVAICFSLSYFNSDEDFEKLEEILSYIEENS